MMVGRLRSFWEGLFSGAMWNLQGVTVNNLPGFFEGLRKKTSKKGPLIFIWISPLVPKKNICSAHPSHDICYPAPYISLYAARVNLERRVLYSRRKATMEASAPGHLVVEDAEPDTFYVWQWPWMFMEFKLPLPRKRYSSPWVRIGVLY